MIPKDWKIFELSELIDKSRSIRYGIVQPGEYDENGRFMVRGQDYSFGWVDPDQLFRVSNDIEAKYKNARLKQGDIILTIVGAGTGKVAIVPDWLDGANITQTTARIAIDSSKAYALYCYYYLSSSKGDKLTHLNVKGGAQPGLNCGDIEKYEVILPPFKEQKKIAEILSTCDEAIEKLSKLINTKEKQKKGLMQSLLTGKVRFKEFERSSRIDVIFTEVAEIIHGYQFRETDFVEHGIPIIKIGNLSDGGDLLLDKLSYISQDRLTEFADCVIRQNDVLMALSGATIGKVTMVKKDIGTFLQNYRVGKFECNPNRLNKTFLYYILQSDFVQSRIVALLNAGAQPNIGKADFDKIGFPLPTIEEQNKIATFLEETDDEIKLLKIQLQESLLQKKGLMQQLLTGKIRVKV